MQQKVFRQYGIEVLSQLRGKDKFYHLSQLVTAFCFPKQQLPPHVRIWDSVTLNTLHVIGTGFFDRAVTCIAFSKSVSVSPVGTAAFVRSGMSIRSELKRRS